MDFAKNSSLLAARLEQAREVSLIAARYRGSAPAVGWVVSPLGSEHPWGSFLNYFPFLI